MITLDKQDVESIAINRFMRRKGKWLWGSLAGYVGLMVLLGFLLDPGPIWTAASIWYTTIIVLVGIAWGAYWIRGMSRASKAMVTEWELDQQTIRPNTP